MFSQQGKDGNVTITTASTVVNQYTYLTQDASTGVNILNVANSSSFTTGDLIFVIQMQGASVPTSSNGGLVSNYNSCGNHEFVEVLSVPSSTSIVLNSNIKNNYQNLGNTQVIKVPRYSSLIINTPGSITCPSWNGKTGGVVIVESLGNISVNSVQSFNVKGKGFRGGDVIAGKTSNFGVTVFQSNNPADGGHKGESIAGDSVVYETKSAKYGKGNFANGGGGGSGYNSGGGGGANGGNLALYNGLGNPIAGYNTQWNLESAGFATNTSSGGGRGGYSFSSGNQNPSTIGPGAGFWGGDSRRNVGGYGGRPLDYTTGRIFLGGGGGAGDGNDNYAGKGGAGGGIVYVLCYGNIAGSGTFIADGANGSNSNNSSAGCSGKDGAGGGGGGGTVVLNSTGTISLTSSPAVSLLGGNGGNQNFGSLCTSFEAYGPGGGGGGGVLLYPSSGAPSYTIAGGNNGIVIGNSSNIASSFPPNGATCGGVGTATLLALSPVASYTISSPKCVGSPISFTDQSSGTPTSWAWTFPAGTPASSTAQNPMVTYTAAGTYSATLVVTNASGPSSPLTQTFAVSPTPTVTITGGGNFCPAQTKTLTAIGSVSSYTWMPSGATTSSIVVTPTATTVYTLTSSDGVGCTAPTNTVALIANSNPVLSTNASPAAICPGGSSNLTAGGATTYTWSNGALTNTTVVTPTVTSTYTVIGRSVVGCTSTKTIAVTVNPTPTITVNSGTICSGNSFTINPSGASTYTYSSGSAVVSPTSTTSYTITGTVGSCTGSAVSNVSVNAPPTLTVNSGGICNGNSYTITASGANTYTWSTGANTNSIVVTPTITTNYSVIGSSTLGCVSSSSAVSTVTVSSTPTLAVNSGSICLGNSFTMTPSGASTYTYSSGSAIVSPTVNTTYTVTGSSAFGCLGAAVVSSVTVYASPTLSITSNPSVACLGNTVTLTASGATTYTWNTGALTNTLAVSPSVNTIYTVTGTTTGCTATKTISVNPIDIVLSSTVTNIACNVSVNSGSISLLPSGGTFPYYYSWSNGATTANIKNLAVGTYSVLVSDANGCLDSLQLTVTRPTSLTVTTSIVNPACGANDGQISSTVSGGTAPYTYIWNSGATTPVASSLTPGQYIIQIYDASNCYGSAIVNLNPTNGPVVTVGTTNSVSCYGGNNGSTSISISGGIAPVTTQWSNGSTLNSLSGLSAGVYDVLVTDASGCKVNQTVVINQPNGLNVQPIVTRPNCTQSNGAISLNISGGQAPFTFTWSANAGGVNTQNVSGIASGYYNVTIGYNGACTQNIGVGVSDLTNIAVNVVTVTPSSCTAPTGSIDIMAVNGVPSYSFSWSNGASTEDINNVFPGNYFVTVTDADLCKTSTSVFVPSNIFDYQPEICLISVDTSNNTNYIVWQKNITYGVEKYKIYRESSVPNNFQFVADVPFSALSEYTDLVANADIHSWRYRLSSVDSCGYEIPSYVDHKTIYLDVTFGATTNDLTWNYYAGFSYNKFYISRYDITNGWQLYDSVPGNIFTYSDILPPPTGEVKYLVEAKAPFNCIPQLKTVVQTSNKTKSNVKNNNFEILTKLQDVLFDNYFFIAPNPAKDELFVNFNKPLSTLTHIRVKDLVGKVLFELTVKDLDKVVIPLKEFTSGLYFIQVENGKNTNVKKFVKE